MTKSSVDLQVSKPDNGKDHVNDTDDGSNHLVEVLDNQTDPVLGKKMDLISDAIEDIGMTPFHWKLFVLTGFGYAVDSVRPYILIIHGWDTID